MSRRIRRNDRDRGRALLLAGTLPAAPEAAQFTDFEATRSPPSTPRWPPRSPRMPAAAVSVAVFIGNEVVWAKGYGWADIENRVAATARHDRPDGIDIEVVHCGLDDAARRARCVRHRRSRSPTTSPRSVAWRCRRREPLPITFRMLASHTAGLAARAGPAGCGVRVPSTDGRARSSSQSRTPVTRRAPLTEYSYSNIGFGMLGLASVARRRGAVHGAGRRS